MITKLDDVEAATLLDTIRDLRAIKAKIDVVNRQSGLRESATRQLATLSWRLIRTIPNSAFPILDRLGGAMSPDAIRELIQGGMNDARDLHALEEQKAKLGM